MITNNNGNNIKATIKASLDPEKHKETEIFIRKEIKKREGVKLESIEFNKDNVKIIILLKSINRLKDVELYIFAHLSFLQMDKKLPEGIKINDVFTKYII